ncbi:MAG: NADH-quinone oxidoreductase subunit D, partial [Desulfovibrionaceae bacterium]|nr:NADH-quinone oxidoreductase subunit D [Desulfovibrionaceae bacterium]
ILRKRVEEIGVFDQDMIRRYGATGPVARGSGIDYDVRRAEPYSVYDRFDWQVPVYQKGDAMARYLVRLDEIEQSMRIVEQALAQLPEGKIIVDKAPKYTWKAPKGEACFPVEGGRGLIAVHVISDGGKTPYKIKLRAPGFSNLSLFAEASRGTLLADSVAILGSLDLIIPEIDR